MPTDEGAAVVLASAGEETTFRAWVEAHGRDLFRLAYRMTDNTQDAEDVVQEAWLRAYRRFSQFQSRAEFGTWVYRITVNCAYDLLRCKRRRFESAAEPGKTALTSPEPWPDRLLLNQEVQAQVKRALAELAPKEKIAFVLRHFEGCSTDEIAQILDIRANAARHAVFRAVRKMRKSLAPMGVRR